MTESVTTPKGMRDCINYTNPKGFEMTFPRLTLFLICWLLMFRFCCADVPPEDMPKIKLAFSGLDDSRMRLNSGVCRITGDSFCNSEHVKDSITIAFDYNKGFYRFDRDDKRSLRTPDYYYECYKHLGVNEIVTRQNTQERTPSCLIQPFDIRNIGFFNFIGPYWKQEYTKDELEKLLKDRPISFEESLSGVFTIMVERIPPISGYPPFKRKYWIDSKQGYSLVRAEYGDADTIEISWKEINHTWVPTSFSLSSTQQNQSAEWKIDWLYVNETVPDDYFDPTLLSEKTTMLVSEELGEPVVIGKVGKGIPLPEMTRPSKNVSYFRYFLFVAGMTMILLALGKKIYNWKTKIS